MPEKSFHLKKYYEDDVLRERFWGTPRERMLVEQIMRAIPTGIKSLVDIGCGDGYLLNIIRASRPHLNLYGLDFSHGRLIGIATGNNQVTLAEGTAEAIPIKNNSFDCVVCSEVLEHVSDYRAAFGELIRISRRYLIITVPNEQAPLKIFCPRCGFEHFFDGHMHTFSQNSIKDIAMNYPQLCLRKIKVFSTIYTYNSLTLKFPRPIRMWFDGCAAALSTFIPFLKPNYILVVIEKTTKTNTYE